MTLNELKTLPNIQERLQAVIKETYNVSYPVNDLVRRASLHPEFLRLEEFEKPLYSVCLQYDQPWVKDILDEIEKDYDNNYNVRRYILNYFTEHGVKGQEETRAAMVKAISTLPKYLQEEPTCRNFKICKAIELSQLEEGKYADVTEALMGNKDAIIDYGSELEDMIESGTPIDVANGAASNNTAKKFNFVSMMAAPVRLKYQIRDSIEQSIADGLGEYGPTYLENKQAIRQRKEEMKRERMEVQQEVKLNKIRNGATPVTNKQDYYVNQPKGNSYRNGTSRMQGYPIGSHRIMSLGLICILIALGLFAINAIIALIQGRILQVGFFVGAGGFILSLLGQLKQSMKEKGWQALSISGPVVVLVGIILLFTL